MFFAREVMSVRWLVALLSRIHAEPWNPQLPGQVADILKFAVSQIVHWSTYGIVISLTAML